MPIFICEIADMGNWIGFKLLQLFFLMIFLIICSCFNLDLKQEHNIMIVGALQILCIIVLISGVGLATIGYTLLEYC